MPRSKSKTRQGKAQEPLSSPPQHGGEALNTAGWKVPRAFLHGFAVSLVIALGIEVFLHWIHPSPRVQDLEDRALDWTVALYRGAAPSRKDPVPFTFLDIDEQTYRDWGEPPFVPRGKLTRLIGTVASACPRVVVVDVDLTRKVDPAADEDLLRYLRDQASASLCERQPLFIFPASLRRSAGRKNAPFLRQPSFLEAPLAGVPNVLWASPLFDRSSDWQIRRWRLWEAACPGGTKAGPPEVVPSIQLLVAGILQEPELSARQILARIRSAVAPMLPETCAAAPHRDEGHSDAHEKKSELCLGGLRLSVPPSRLNQRISFRYPASAELRQGEAYPRDPATGREMVSVIPASPIFRRAAVSPDLFRDRIVVIGGSYEEGRDTYRTPLGPMPGAMILINSIDSLLEHGEVEPPSRPVRSAVLVLSVLAMSAVFASFTPRKATLIALALLLLGLLPLSVFLFREGYWLDFAVPMVAVFLHRAAADIEGRFFHRKHAETH